MTPRTPVAAATFLAILFAGMAILILLDGHAHIATLRNPVWNYVSGHPALGMATAWACLAAACVVYIVANLVPCQYFRLLAWRDVLLALALALVVIATTVRALEVKGYLRLAPPASLADRSPRA